MAIRAGTNNPAISSLTENPVLLWVSVAAAAAVLGLAVGQGLWWLVLLLASVPVVLRWPIEVTFGLFVLLIPFEDISLLGGEGSRTLVWLVGGLAACSFVAVGLADKRLERPPRTALWWSLFVLWGCASMLWAADPHAALIRLPTFLSLWVLYLAASSFRLRKNEMQWIVLMVILGGCAAALFAVYQFYGGVHYAGRYQTNRETLALGESETNPNKLALAFLLPLSLALAQFLGSRRRLVKLAMLAGVAVIGVAIFLTMSRGGLLSLLVVLVLFSIRLKVGRKVLVVAALLSALTMTMPQEFFDRIKGESGGAGGAGRLYIWKVGWKLFKDHAIVGAGFDNFPVVYNRYAGDAPVFEGFGRGSHNVYLKVVVDLGLVGFLFFLLAINSQRNLVASCKQYSSHGPPTLLVASEAAFWAVLTFSFFGDPLYDKAFWLPWIMLTFAIKMAPEESTESSLQPARP